MITVKRIYDEPAPRPSSRVTAPKAPFRRGFFYLAGRGPTKPRAAGPPSLIGQYLAQA
jgi:hypothetical protein